MIICSHNSPPQDVGLYVNILTSLPCDVLLQIANLLKPEDYLNLSAVSHKIDLCLSEGKYTIEKDTAVLKQAQKKILEKWLDYVTSHPNLFSQIPNPPEKLMKAAIFGTKNVSGHYRIMNYIPEAFQIKYVKQKPDLLLYMEEPSENVQLAAVEQDGYAICFVNDKKPTERVMLVAVKQNPGAIQYISNPSEQVQIIAATKAPARN